MTAASATRRVLVTVFAFLLSSGASDLAGVVVPVDGGLSAAIGVHR
jgi:hypothetical protein